MSGQSKYVWVVSNGETGGEGGFVIAVFFRKPSMKVVVGLTASPFGEWKLVDDMRWVSGCDFLKAERHKIL